MGGAGSGGQAQSGGVGGDVCEGAPVGAPPRLHTEGRFFKDPEGNTVILRGVALADVKQMDLERTGASTNRVIDWVSDADDEFHARVARLTVYPETWLTDPDGYLEDHLKPAVMHARERGLYAIVDWHEISDVAPVAERTAEFWERVAPVFADDEHVLYELFNEPMDADNPDWASWKAVAQPWVDAIRGVAPQTIVLIGGPFWSQQIGGAATDPFEGDNLAYVGHIYPIIDPHTWSDSGPFAQVAAVHPLMITEWGFRDDGADIWGGTADSFGNPVKSFIESHQLSWTAWCADNLWAPIMFDTDWSLLSGPGEMGGFVKDWLSERKNDNQPGGPRNCPSSPASGGAPGTGGVPGTGGEGGQGGQGGIPSSCAPQDAFPDGTQCATIVGYARHPGACLAIQCGCQGADCDDLFATSAACEAAYEGCPVPNP